MNLWDSLVLSAAGGALTLLGSWVGHHLQARDQSKVRAEQVARDNLLRLHTERVTAYAAFYREAGNMRAAMSAASVHPTNSDMARKVRAQRSELFGANTLVALIGDPQTERAAWALLRYATGVTYDDVAFDQERWGRLISDFVLGARANLLFPEQTDIPLSAVDTSPVPLAARPPDDEGSRTDPAKSSAPEAN